MWQIQENTILTSNKVNFSVQLATNYTDMSRGEDTSSSLTVCVMRYVCLFVAVLQF